MTSGTADRIGTQPLRPATRRWLLHALRNRRRLEVLAATGLYFGFACFLTWPVITDPTHIFYGSAGDPYGTMAFFRELVAHHHNPFLPGTITQLAAPEGQPIPWTRDLAAMPSVLTQFLLTAGLGQIGAYNLYALAGYTLSGVVMFLFVRRLTSNVWIALLCGWAFAFYPFAAINGQGHADYIHGWVLVLAIWRLLELVWQPTRRNAILAGFAVAFAMWWTPYFILFGGIAYVAAVLASLAIAWRDKIGRAVVRVQAITAAIVVVFLGLLASLAAGASGQSLGLRTNTLAEFNTYSARPLEYLLPDVLNPLFGSDTRPYLTSHLHGSNFVESTLYIGVTVIFLALAGVVAAARGRTQPRVTRAVVLLSVVAVAALLCSAPPEATIFGLSVPFPSHFIMKVTTTWRAYSRFVVVVMLAFVALAGIGLAWLMDRRRPAARVIVLLAAIVLVPLDLWGRLPVRTNDYAVPTVFKVLSRQPRGLTAEYPLTPNGYNLYVDVFYQNVYGMPLINGYLAGSPEERRAVSLSDLADPSTGPRLAALGVRYVIEEAAPPGYGLAPPGTPGRGFQLIFRDSWASLYRVTARPAGPAVPAASDGFGDDEPAPGGLVDNWLEQPSGKIELAGSCRGCRGILRLRLISFARPRLVTIMADGRVLLRKRVAAPTEVSVPLTYTPGRSVTVTAQPGPQSISKTIGGLDTRSVSVEVSDLQFVWAPARGSG